MDSRCTSYCLLCVKAAFSFCSACCLICSSNTICYLNVDKYMRHWVPLL